MQVEKQLMLIITKSDDRESIGTLFGFNYMRFYITILEWLCNLYMSPKFKSMKLSKSTIENFERFSQAFW